jgi:hypothetical protein
MANDHSITDFITQFGGGTRLNRFKITGKLGNIVTNTPNTNLADGGGTYYIRSASIPGSQVGGIPVNYRGRTVVYPGDRIYSPWNIIVLDENPNSSGGINLYKAFHQWSENINSHVFNTTANPNDPSAQFSNRLASNTGSAWTVEQLDTNGAATIRKFLLHNCWPIAVGPIELDMGQDNTIATFSVTMIYSHFEIGNM